MRGGEKYMKKIISAVIMLVLSLGGTAGIAYASLSSTVNLNNVSFSLATAPNLEISLDGTTFNHGTINLAGQVLSGLKPGDSVTIPIIIRNAGIAGDVTYKLSTQLISANAGSDWAGLSPLISAKFGASGPSGTLAEWNASPIDLGVTLAPAQQVSEDIKITLSSSADNTVAGHILSTNWVLTGTQTP